MATSAGTLVRDWRLRRRRSQLDLAVDVGVSARHLSFVETGRSKASPELLLALAEHLEIPLRERNTVLLAAGYAPRFTHTSLDDAAMSRVRAALQRMLDLHNPYPGVVIDRAWNVVLANVAVTALIEGLPPHVVGSPTNVFRVCLHPEGLAPMTRNFDEWSAYLLGQLGRLRSLTAAPEVAALDAEVSGYANLAGRDHWREAAAGDEAALLVPWRVEVGGRELSFFTTLTSFGTPQDISLAELAVELFYPADEATEVALTP
jgi:transcriptional regulator with XRE-family HTH domain